jgi:predicted ATPase
MTPLTLTRLERPQVEALLTHLAGAKTLPPEVVAYIVARTDGVPLFVEELTKMLLESDVLHQEAECYMLTGPLSAVAIPTTLQDSLMARLDRLPMIREVAQLGAVLGREFAYEMLSALAGVEESTLQERLAQLVDTELLYQRGRPPRAKYIFKACPGAGRGIRLLAEEHAAAGAPAGGPAVGGPLPRHGCDRAGAGGAPLH